MNKLSKIDYVNRIGKYFNLLSLCRIFNETQSEHIDYNNLRVVLNLKSINRLSEDKIDKFILFIQTTVVNDIMSFPEDTKTLMIIEGIEEKIKVCIDKLFQTIKEESRNDIYTI